MQPIPVKVKNVSVYPYLGIPGGPVVMPVITGASGTYAVGTLGLSVFYNLNLSGGKQTGTLGLHDQYIATGEFDNGTSFTTVWMYCLEAGKAPAFGRTITTGTGDTAADSVATAQPLHVPAYFRIAPLTDITVSQLFPPPAVGQVVLIQNAKGFIIASRVGTPHIMGVEVSGGRRSPLLHTGMTRIIITGKTKDGHLYSVTNETCLSAADPAVFFRLFP